MQSYLIHFQMNLCYYYCYRFHWFRLNHLCYSYHLLFHCYRSYRLYYLFHLFHYYRSYRLHFRHKFHLHVKNNWICIPSMLKDLFGTMHNWNQNNLVKFLIYKDCSPIQNPFNILCIRPPVWLYIPHNCQTIPHTNNNFHCPKYMFRHIKRIYQDLKGNSNIFMDWHIIRLFSDKCPQPFHTQSHKLHKLLINHQKNIIDKKHQN